MALAAPPSSSAAGAGPIVQVLPDAPGGVRDYVDCLTTHWSQPGTNCATLVLTAALARERPLHLRLADLVAAESASALRPCSVMLHFSGYGYARRGVCWWLLDQLAMARQAWGERMKLVLVFHELYAFGPPWRSAFWVSPLQETIARRLARMADVLWTNTERHAKWLRGVALPGTPLHVRAVFSNVGEPVHVPPLAERAPRAVVFGSAPTRARAFAGLSGAVATLRRLGVEQVVEAGSGPSCAPAALGLPCEAVGPLPAIALSRMLSGSRFGLIDYAPDELAKSGVFASYAAHGCVALNATRCRRIAADGLEPGRHYLSLRDPMTRASSADDCAATIRRWYLEHALARQARDFLTVFAGSHSVQAARTLGVPC